MGRGDRAARSGGHAVLDLVVAYLRARTEPQAHYLVVHIPGRGSFVVLDRQ